MRKLNRLTDRTVKTTLPGKHPDGAGLYLVATQGRTGINRNWSFRYSIGNGKHQRPLRACFEIYSPRFGKFDRRSGRLLPPTPHRKWLDDRDPLLPGLAARAFQLEHRKADFAVCL